VPIRVSPLRGRANELPTIVKKYAEEAISTLGAPAKSFTNADLSWVIEHAASSLAEIEKATLRVVALKASANHLPHAARLLGMAPISLTKWLKRRSQPPPSLAGVIPSRGRGSW